MTVARGRPKQNTPDMAAMTLRLDRSYYRKLRALAAECGIRSVNAYAVFMLYSHVNGVEADKRNAAAEAEA